MKKIINGAESFVPEMLEGIYAAHPGELAYADGDLHCMVNARRHEGKVGLVTGGGSGHLPLFLGYVGEGMLDGCAIGDVFQSPSAEQMLAVTRHIDQGKGVLYIYGNYNGDIFNFDSAAEMADFEENIRVESCVAGEDVAGPAPEPGEANKRRGVAGIFSCSSARARPRRQGSTWTTSSACRQGMPKRAHHGCGAYQLHGAARGPAECFIIAEDEMEIGMASMANRACVAGSCWRRTDRGRNARERCLPICPTKAGTRSPCWSTAWARRRGELYVISAA
jgi:dihydroxyacetone kinase-like protein